LRTGGEERLQRLHARLSSSNRNVRKWSMLKVSSLLTCSKLGRMKEKVRAREAEEIIID
jgi:hypothetical protein